MLAIRFIDEENERRALGWLVGRFSFKSFKNGPTIVPESALAYLAWEGIQFTVEGPATHEQLRPGPPSLRDSSAEAI